MRDLVRAREDAVGVGTQAKYRLKAFLLRQGRRYPGREGWTLPYRRWLADLSFPSAAQHITLQEYRDAIDETEQRIDRLTEQLRQLAPTWRWAPVVAALQALRGVSFVTAVALVAELGDLTRFRHPRDSWRISGSCRRNIRVGPVFGAAALRRGRQIRTCGGCSRSRTEARIACDRSRGSTTVPLRLNLTNCSIFSASGGLCSRRRERPAHPGRIR